MDQDHPCSPPFQGGLQGVDSGVFPHPDPLPSLPRRESGEGFGIRPSRLRPVTLFKAPLQFLEPQAQTLHVFFAAEGIEEVAHHP